MEANTSDSEPAAELPEEPSKTIPEDADSKNTDIVAKPEGSKDLINAILGEMKSEFNRDLGIVAKPEELNDIAAKTSETVSPAKDNGCKSELVKSQTITNSPNDSGTKPKLQDSEIIKNGNNATEPTESISNPKVETPTKDASKSVIPQKDAIAEILKDLPRILPKPVPVALPVLITSQESKETSPVKEGDGLPGKTCVTPGSENKPRLVLTLKAGEDLSDGHKKQKSKGGNSHSGSEGVWTVKVDTDNQITQSAPPLTGKRSLRSQTVVKSPAEPEGVKRSARRRSKDLPRESVLQSAMARKEKSFSLGNEDKQSRAPKYRSLNRSLDKPLKSDLKKVPVTKKTEILVIKPIKMETVVTLPKVVSLDPPNNSPASKPDRPDVPLLNTEHTSSSTNFETDSAHSSSFGSTESIVNGSQSRASPIVNRSQASSSRIMLAIKSAPNSPSLAYSKTGKRRHKPFRGMKYSLNGVSISRRAKAPPPNQSESALADDVSEDSVIINVDGTESINGGNDDEDTSVIDESFPAANSTSFLKRKLSGESDYFGGESGKRGRQDVVPSPSPADGNNLPSTPESTAISSGAGTAAICLCRTRSQLFVSNAVSSNGNDIYCQAVDSLDDRLVGCCNSIFGAEVRMMRPSQKVPYMILCSIHTERLLRHNCCPGCGMFCTQGKFMHCSSNHFYHRGCQLTGDICPHCGVDSPPDESHLYFKSHSNPVFVSQQKSTKKLPSAKMGFVGGTMDDADTEVPLQASDTVLVLANGIEVSSQGLPPSLDKEKLESLLKIATTMPLNPAIRFSVKSLYQAAKSGNPERLLNVLVSGQNPNHQFREGVTCLHLAAVSGNISSVHILVQVGAELDAMDRDQNTALMLATLTCNNGVIKYLVKAGASVTLKGSDGQTALHLAAKSGNLEACHYLLAVANVGRSYINSEDDGGWTPLVWAAEHCHVLVAKFLLDRRADPFVRDAEQNIALHWSAFSGCVDISELLLNYGCEVNCVNVHGDTPLHIGARQNMYHCALLLLMRGARVDLKNKAGDSPLECCSVQPSDCYTVINLNKQLQNITRVAARRLLCNDISRGKETNPVQCVNNEDEEGEPTDFVYVSENCFTSNIVVDRTITSLQSCRCTHDLCTSADCKCGNVSLQCWYDPQGKLLPEFNFADPPMIFECNQGCACNRVTCHNRVVQHGLTSRFQLFRTREKGWGVRTLRNIEKGAYVCEYIGEIISDCEADQREDDSYLFDLDNRDGETYCIDARHYGNVARFINHMCVPNLMPVRVFIDHQDLHFPRIAFFANRDIAADEELGFDYGEKFWIIKCKSFTCTCGADTCRYSDVTIHQTLENYRRKQQLEDTLVL